MVDWIHARTPQPHIVHASDRDASAAFLADVLGLWPEPGSSGPFKVVDVANGVSLDFIEADGLITQHYAFLVASPSSTRSSGRIQARGLTYWADPFHRRRARSTTRTAAAASIFLIRTGTSWRSHAAVRRLTSSAPTAPSVTRQITIRPTRTVGDTPLLAGAGEVAAPAALPHRVLRWAARRWHRR